MEKGERSFQVNLLSKFVDCISGQKIHTMVNIPEDKIFHYSGHKNLEKRFSKSNDGKKINNNNNISICKLDLNCKADYEKIGYEKFDSIIAINVLEHVEDDIFALQQLYKMLKSEGILIILVPCHKFLYNVIDTNVGHFRRYTKKDLELKIRKTRFSIERMFYF